MVRAFITSFVIVASFSITTLAGAQTCDPYRTRIDVDYRTYPTPETAAAFFATLDQGEPVEGHAPYVWRHDAQGWHWSCAPTSAPDPSHIRLEVSRYYQTAYTSVFVVLGKALLSSPIDLPGEYFVIRYLSGPDGCGTVLRRTDRAHRGVFGEVAPTEPSARCRATLSIEQ